MPNHRTSVPRFAWLSFAVLMIAPGLTAQWAVFQDETALRSNVASGLFASDPEEKDYAVADLDLDGDEDIVVVRKQPATSTGAFPNVLLMNENGVLTDRTAQWASASNVLGSQGFLDATNDRDVAIADLNGDGWPDVVTAVTLGGNAAAKAITHPRIYINLGDDTQGVWQGLIFDDENRAPTMPAEPRFCAVSAGDIDGDGDLDLFFSDYDNGPYGRTSDLNDRLWINNGQGYFNDETALRMTAGMVQSGFGANCVILDMNQDGVMDIARHNVPTVGVAYNNPANPGYFTNFQTIYSGSAYNFGVGDLNNDGLMDISASDDGQDRYQLGSSVTGGQLNFGPQTAFTYTGGGGDDGFSGTERYVDLNNDGFQDVIITDFDVDVNGCNRRAHIFRNLGNIPNVTMQEQQTNGAVAGIPTGSLSGTFDIAPIDINGDGWKDLVVGRCSGTAIWMNQPPFGMTFSFPIGLPYYITPGVATTVRVQVTPTGASQVNTSTAQLHYSVAGGSFTTVPMTHLGSNLFEASIPGVACIQQVNYYVSCQDIVGTLRTDPSTAPVATYEAIAAVSTATTYSESFEGTATGWTVVNDASLTGGGFELAVPNGGYLTTVVVAPGDDAEQSLSNTKAYVTQNAPTPSSSWTNLNLYDVDGGGTDLISPAINLAGTDGSVSYARFFWSSSAADNLIVSVSNDNGSTWSTVETVLSATGTTNAWTVKSFRVGDFVAPTAQVRVRFRAVDNGTNSFCEAGIDAFRVDAFVCNVTQPSVGLQGPGTTTLDVSGGSLVAGTTATITYTGGDPFGIAYLIADFALNPTVFGAGTAISPAPPIIQTTYLDGQGGFVIPGLIGGIGPLTMYIQSARVANVPGFIDFSNGVAITWP